MADKNMSQNCTTVRNTIGIKGLKNTDEVNSMALEISLDRKGR